jgi:toxin YoeB
VRLVFADRAWEDYLHWQVGDPNTLERLNVLIKECMRTPFAGAGKPEPLKGDLRGWWSRRVTLEDRLVYRVSGSGVGQQLEIAQCRFHYERR